MMKQNSPFPYGDSNSDNDAIRGPGVRGDVEEGDGLGLWRTDSSLGHATSR